MSSKNPESQDAGGIEPFEGDKPEIDTAGYGVEYGGEEGGSTLWNLGNNILLTMDVDNEDEQYTLRFYELVDGRNDGPRELITKTDAPDTWMQETVMHTVVNAVTSMTDTIEKDWLQQRIREIRNIRDEMGYVLEYQEMAEGAKDILHRTKSVKSRREGDTTVTRVTLEAPDKCREVTGIETGVLVFEGAEWMSAAEENAIGKRHFNTFQERVELGGCDDEVLKFWEQERTLGEVEEVTNVTAAVDNVVSSLKKRVEGDVYADRGRVHDGVYNSWYDGSRVCVKNDAIEDIIEQTRSEVDLNRLAIELVDAGVMTDTTERKQIDGQKFSLWPFAPEKLGITDPDEQVIDDDDGDEPEVEP